MSMIGILIRVTSDQLSLFIQDSSLLEDYIDSDEMQEHETKLDIHKYWDGINFLLLNTKTTDTIISKAIFSGQIVDEEQDLGYGPAQYLTVLQVRDISQAFSAIEDSYIKQTFNAEKMNANGIYLEPWSDNPQDVNDLMQYYKELKDFYRKAALNNQAVITYIE